MNYVGFGIICKIVKIIGSTILCFNHSLFFFSAHSSSHSVAAALVTLLFTLTNWFGFLFPLHFSAPISAGLFSSIPKPNQTRGSSCRALGCADGAETLWDVWIRGGILVCAPHPAQTQPPGQGGITAPHPAKIPGFTGQNQQIFLSPETLLHSGVASV